MSIIAKTMANYYEFESQVNVNPADTQMGRSKIAPSWVVALLIIAEIGIIAFFVLIYSGKSGPLIQFDEDTIPTLAVIVVCSLVFTTIYLSNRRLKRISADIIRALELRGMSFLKEKSRLFAPLEGNYRGLKCRLSFGLRSDDSPEHYTLNILHEKKLNLRLFCTNIIPNRSGKTPELPSLRPFGTTLFEVPDLRGVNCWAADEMLGRQVLGDFGVREKLVSLAGIINDLSGRFAIDDYGVRLAFEANVIPPPSVIDTAYNLSLSLGHSNLLPARPIAPTFRLKFLRSIVLTGILIFLVIFFLTIINGHL